MDAQTLIEIRSALADLHAAVSTIALQVNAHSIRAHLDGVAASIKAMTCLIGNDGTEQAKGTGHE